MRLAILGAAATEASSNGPDASASLEVRINDEADVDLDGRQDLLVTLGHRGGSGEWAHDCGSYGECQTGLLIACGHDSFVDAIPIDYRYELAFSDGTQSIGGRRVRPLVETVRLHGSALLEAEAMDRGEPLFGTQTWLPDAGGTWAPGPLVLAPSAP